MSLSTKEGPGGFRKEFLSRSFKELSFWSVSVNQGGPTEFRKEFLSRSFKELSFWSVSVNQGGPRRVPKGVPFKEL